MENRGDARMKFTPHAYQRYNINRILTNPNLALWLDMG